MAASETAMGIITEHTPSTMSILKVLEPMTLLTARALAPFTAEVMDTASSGALVPMATMVRPMIRAGTLNFAARAAAPSTKKSAPLISSTNPTTSSRILRRILTKPPDPI